MRFTRFVTGTLTVALAIVGMAIPLTAAQQVEVHLRNGTVVVGEVVSDEADKLVIKYTALGKNGKAMTMNMPYKRADIDKVVKLADPAEQYRTKSAAATSATEHWALSQWCRQNNLHDQAIIHAKKTVELDATQQDAVKMLTDMDLALIDGKWVKESEALAAKGKIRHQGKVMTIAEADALKALAQKNAAFAGAEKTVEEKEKLIVYIDKEIADSKKRSTEIDTSLQKANNDLSAAQALAQKVPEAKEILEAAEKSLEQGNIDAQIQLAAGVVGVGADLQPLRQAVENAQKALSAARREAGNSEGLVRQAKAKISSLTNEKNSLEKKLEGLATKREAAVKALEQAKAAKDAIVKPTP